MVGFPKSGHIYNMHAIMHFNSMYTTTLDLLIALMKYGIILQRYVCNCKLANLNAKVIAYMLIIPF